MLYDCVSPSSGVCYNYDCVSLSSGVCCGLCSKKKSKDEKEASDGKGKYMVSHCLEHGGR